MPLLCLIRSFFSPPQEKLGIKDKIRERFGTHMMQSRGREFKEWESGL